MEPIYENVNLQREYRKYLWDLRHWPIFRVLQPDIKCQIYMVMVFGDATRKSALIVTKAKRVYAIGNNSVGQLGSKLSRNESIVIKPREIQELREINIKTIVTMGYSVFTITKKGKVFVWGDNSHRLLGLGKNTDKYVYEPTLLINLCMIHIVDISCSTDFVLALTKNGIVYAWGLVRNFRTYVPVEVKLKWKVSQIACNSWLNVIVTTDGDVYTWDKNQMDIQHNRIHTKLNMKFFGIESVFPLKNKIVKVACGRCHMLALTKRGTLYVWGDNTLGFLGLGHNKPLSEYPDLINLEKVLDIAVMPETNLNAAICKDKCVYVWGQCYGLEIKTPLATLFSNIHEAFAYDSLGCMHEPLVISTNRDSDEETEKKGLALIFDNHKLDLFDFKLKIDKKMIYLRKNVLKSRCQYFKSLNESDWKDKNVVLLGKFSYMVYRAFFKYLYTGRIDLSLEKTFDLLALAKMYEAEDLLRDVKQMIMREINALKVSTIDDRV